MSTSPPAEPSRRRRRRAVGPAGAVPAQEVRLDLEDERPAPPPDDDERLRREVPPHHGD